MRKLGVAITTMMLSAGAYACCGGGHGGGGHSSAHASAHVSESHEGSHEAVSEHEGESGGSGGSEAPPRRTNPFIVIPHGSSSHAACPNGVASEVQGNASETAVQCYTDPAPQEDSGNKAVMWAFFLFGLAIVIAICAA